MRILKHYTENRICEYLNRGVEDGIYPGAVLLIACEGRIIFLEKTGYLSLRPDPIPMQKDTVFDLASLTKPLAMTTTIMKMVDEGKVGLDQSLSEILPISPKNDKKNLTLRLMLSHSAGFPDWKPFYAELDKYRPEQRKRILREWILKEPFAYIPGKGCTYSDLGFMILEWVAEEISGMSFRHLVEDFLIKPLLLRRIYINAGLPPKRFHGEEIAATEACSWRDRIIQGEVHDENAHALGGYSGHAGLFGSAEEVFHIVNMLREHYHKKRDDYFRPETVKEFFRRQGIVKGCTWALGWDTPSMRNSSSGRYFSLDSVGHLGFTGTSIWMDLERDVMVILLTNRIHPTRSNQKIRAFRPAIHDLIMEELLRK